MMSAKENGVAVSDFPTPEAKHVLIFVMGGDMRDLRHWSRESGWSNAAIVAAPLQEGFWGQPRFQGMRPLGPWSFEPSWIRETEIFAIVDRFDEPEDSEAKNGVYVQRIYYKDGKVETEEKQFKEKSPELLLPALLEHTNQVGHRAVLFWGHGNGIFGGLLGDAHPDESGRPAGNWLPLHEAAEFMENGLENKKVDLVGVIGCFAGMVETLHAFQPYTHTFMGFGNKMDPAFFPLDKFVREMARNCTCDSDGAERHEHWAAAGEEAIKCGYEAFDGSPEYSFANCAASAWRTQGLVDALVAQEEVVNKIIKAWPRVLEQAAGATHYYDSMHSADLVDLVYQVWKYGGGNGESGAGFDSLWPKNQNELTDACSKFLKAAQNALIWSFVKGYDRILDKRLKGLGVWLPRAAGPAFAKVATAYERLRERGMSMFGSWLELQRGRFGISKPVEYRRKDGGHPWHWCKNCSQWPADGTTYEWRRTKPVSGRLDAECEKKAKTGDCETVSVG